MNSSMHSAIKAHVISIILCVGYQGSVVEHNITGEIMSAAHISMN